jgi:hypothetical protein
MTSKLNDEAREFLRQHDEEYGPAWSETAEGLADFMEEFAQVYLDQIVEVIHKGTGNRRYWKRWEKTVLTLCNKETEGM